MNSKKSGSFINTQINPYELNKIRNSDDDPFTLRWWEVRQKKWGLIMKPNLSFFVKENDSDPV